MNIKCLKCNTVMVQHGNKYVCLLCEHEIEVESATSGRYIDYDFKCSGGMPNDIKSASELGDK